MTDYEIQRFLRIALGTYGCVAVAGSALFGRGNPKGPCFIGPVRPCTTLLRPKTYLGPNPACMALQIRCGTSPWGRFRGTRLAVFGPAARRPLAVPPDTLALMGTPPRPFATFLYHLLPHTNVSTRLSGHFPRRGPCRNNRALKQRCPWPRRAPLPPR